MCLNFPGAFHQETLILGEGGARLINIRISLAKKELCDK